MAGNDSTGWKASWARFMRDLEAAFVVPKGRGRLVRPRYGRKLAGVCAGLAAYYGWDVKLLRVLVVVLTVMLSGLLAVAYLVAWVVIPEGHYKLAETASAPRGTPSS